MAMIAHKEANKILDGSIQSDKKVSSMHDDVFTDAQSESQASIDTLDNYVGPVREEFDELKRKIEDKEHELAALESDYYKRVSSVALELEGIGSE